MEKVVDHAEVFLDHTLAAALSVAQDRAKKRRPTRLFHFTTASGALGIQKSQSIWASLATSLNDASELIYAETVALAVAQSGVSGVTPDLTTAFANVLQGGPVSPHLPLVTLSVYVASFCDTEDASSQWLNYGGRGTGIALELTPEGLAAPPFELTKVTYSVKKQRKAISEILIRVNQSISTACSVLGIAPDARHYEAGAHVALQGLRLLAPALKAPAFSSEREWRLVTFEISEQPAAGLPLTKYYRTVGSRIVPYVERSFAPDGAPTAAIVLGYSCPHAITDAVFSMLVPAVPVRRSTVSVRP